MDEFEDQDAALARIEEEHDPDRVGEVLSPRHRKFAEMLAAGARNKEIKEALGYSDSRISILKREPKIVRKVNEIMDRSFEKGVGARLKELNEPAMQIIEQILTDNTRRISPKEKAEMAKWVLEKTDGKAVQKHEVSGGLLHKVMDRLDQAKELKKHPDELPDVIDVTPERTEAELTEEELEQQKLLDRWKEGL